MAFTPVYVLLYAAYVVGGVLFSSVAEANDRCKGTGQEGCNEGWSQQRLELHGVWLVVRVA